MVLKTDLYIIQTILSGSKIEVRNVMKIKKKKIGLSIKSNKSFSGYKKYPPQL